MRQVRILIATIQHMPRLTARRGCMIFETAPQQQDGNHRARTLRPEALARRVTSIAAVGESESGGAWLGNPYSSKQVVSARPWPAPSTTHSSAPSTSRMNQLPARCDSKDKRVQHVNRWSPPSAADQTAGHALQHACNTVCWQERPMRIRHEDMQ